MFRRLAIAEDQSRPGRGLWFSQDELVELLVVAAVVPVMARRCGDCRWVRTGAGEVPAGCAYHAPLLSRCTSLATGAS
jgi:hypothetical protein